MPLDDLVEYTLKHIAAHVLNRIFYWPGWLVLRIITFGRYPPPRESPHNEAFVAMVGLAAFIAPITIYFTHVR